jgi:wyosine [tRNA(Phe)-imidazoG37] synthetase (radical SAM superfamily)
MNMEDENIELINDFIQTYKPDGVDILELDIVPTSGRYEYYIKPQYIIDKDNHVGYDLMTIIWKDKKKTDWHTKGDIVFGEFEKKMSELIGKYFEIDVYFKGRGVTEKSYWSSQKIK